MAINPLGSQGPSAAGTQRPGEAPRRVDGTAPAAGAVNPADATASDQLQLSDTAAAVGSGVAVPSGELSPDALRTIAQKLASGAYDGAAVADRIAGKLLDSGDLTTSA